MSKSTVSIQESAVFSPPEKVKKYTDGKVIFETYLQEAEERNQNKRVYPKDVIDTGLRRIQEKISKRSFLGELDHPISTNQVRQTTVLYKEASHIIREWGWDGNLLKGVIETMPYSPNGKILSGMAVDQISIGFSLRGLADVQDNGQFQLVMSPLICIAYDAVSEPSNAKATIQEIRNEQLLHVVSESKNLICTSDGHCYLPDYFDQLVENNIMKLRKKYWQ
jgi:hypothetical protein